MVWYVTGFHVSCSVRGGILVILVPTTEQDCTVRQRESCVLVWLDYQKMLMFEMLLR